MAVGVASVSLILDALNRSRQDSDPVPGLATQHPVEQVSSGRRQYLPWAALVVAVVLIAWLLLERDNTPPAASSGGGIAAPVAELSQNIDSAAASTVTTQLKSRVEAEKPQRAKQPDRVIVPALPVQAAQPAADSALNPNAAPALADDEADAVARLYQQQESAQSKLQEAASPAALQPGKAAAPAPAEADNSGASGRQEQPVDVEELLLQTRREMKNSGLVEHPAPFVPGCHRIPRTAFPPCCTSGTITPTRPRNPP